jgi:hypothetical protein
MKHQSAERLLMNLESNSIEAWEELRVWAERRGNKTLACACENQLADLEDSKHDTKIKAFNRRRQEILRPITFDMGGGIGGRSRLHWLGTARYGGGTLAHLVLPPKTIRDFTFRHSVCDISCRVRKNILVTRRPCRNCARKILDADDPLRIQLLGIWQSGWHRLCEEMGCPEWAVNRGT